MDGKKKAAYLAIVLVLVVSAVGAYNLIGGQNEEEKSVEFPITVTDDRGENVEITRRPENIVCITPVTTEIVFALGAGDRVVGVDSYADYPPEVEEGKENGSLEIIGEYSKPSVEKVIGTNPDLIIVGGYQSVTKSRVQKLEQVGIPVLCFKGENIPDAISDIETIGKSIGASKTAKEIAENMREEIQEVEERTENLDASERPGVFWQVWWDPIYTMGSDTFIDSIVEICGGQNIFDDKKGYISVSKETVIGRDPEFYMVPPHSGKTVEEVKNTPGFSEVEAIKDNQVYSVPKNIFSRPGPRLADAVKVLSYILHPDMFEKPSLSYTEIPEVSE